MKNSQMTQENIEEQNERPTQKEMETNLEERSGDMRETNSQLDKWLLEEKARLEQVSAYSKIRLFNYKSSNNS